MIDTHVAVIGAGPCGLGCLRELDRLGVHDVVVLEAASGPGGLASSVTDEHGFTWDRGGHVVFSHHGEFDRLLADVLCDEVLHHDRSSWVLADGSWVPYPFQNNLHRLEPDTALECLVGLIEAEGATARADFESWIRATFGPGVARHFMIPYNEKVWATAPSAMGSGWIAERVSTTDWRKVLASALSGTDDLGWGPNNRFAFPAVGGTGEIWRRAAAPFGGRIRYDSAVEWIDATAGELRTVTGEEVRFDHLVSTMPLDLLVQRTVDSPDEIRRATGTLVHNTVHVVGVGYEAPLVDDRSWLYFADPEVPFYRATNFAKYSPANVPGSDTGRYSSWMCEVSSSTTHPRTTDGLGEAVEAALRGTGVVTGHPDVVSLHVEEVPYAYPVPTLGRDAALHTVLPWFEQRHIHSRGRFGTWRYEIGNMDHAVKMGTDVARRIAADEPEELV